MRNALHVLWAVVILLMLMGFIFWGMVLAAYLLGVSFLGVGALAGVVSAVVVSHNLRGWLKRLRLRSCDVTVKATVTRCDLVSTVGTSGPGSSVYTVLVRWDGVDHKRQYFFIGRGPKDFPRARSRVRVRYPAKHPRRFVIDIPYASTMADFVL